MARAGTEVEAQEYYRELERRNLVALWNVASTLMPREPRSRAVPCLWSWTDLLPLLRQAGALAPLGRGAERRVLGFVNPGLRSRHGATATLWAAFQYLLPGEVAPAHRHSQAAVRFILDGHGAFTTVDGDKCVMSRGDLVLTPPWSWHDHGSEGDAPMVRFDGLDLPLVAELEAAFFEAFPDDAQPLRKPPGRLGAPLRVRTAQAGLGEAGVALLPAAQLQVGPDAARPRAARRHRPRPLRRRGHRVHQPPPGGSVLPTIACWIQTIRRGVGTRAHRHSSSAG